ncbi:MAG: hypothetical protein AB1733_01670 [Thermodesulfobacteriota bacterium]
MVKKFNLSVPDELAEKIEARREYLGNLSSLFQEAVREKIRKKEDWEKRIKEGEDKDTMIERLRREKAEAENDYYEQGMKDGVDWAKNSSYTDLQYMLNFNPENFDLYGNSSYSMTDLTQDEILGESFQQIFDENPALLCDDSGMLNDLAVQWFLGWRAGAETFWEEIKDKL